MKPRNDENSPRWLKNLLHNLLDARTAESSLGDLEEKFEERIRRNVPRWKAVWLYTFEGLGFVRMARTGRVMSIQTNINMINHTLLFFGRLLRRDAGYYLVSILGLAMSLVSFLLIMMFIADELSYDRFHAHSDRVYRVTTHLRLSDLEYNLATTPFPAAQVIREEVEGVKYAVRLFPQEFQLESGDKKFLERVMLADEDFFRVFTFPFLMGDTATALSDPMGVVLTHSAAIRYFGSEDAVGKTLVLNGQTLEVTGVINDVPEQAHFRFDAVIPLAFQLNQWKAETGLEGRENKWYWVGAYTYLLMQENTLPPGDLLSSIVKKYFPERYQENGKLRLQPLKDIHLTSTLSNELEPGGNMLYVRLFSVIAFVIMLVSAINLINLTWFKITARIRELGIRKFLGQNPARIVAQLCLESILLGVTSFAICLVLAVLLINAFNDLVQKNLDLWSPVNLQLTGFTALLIIIICIAAVIKPAVHYARASGYWMMQRYTSATTARLRNLLIGLQVGFSFVLLVFSFIVSSQIDFFRHKDLGFDRENVVVVELNEDLYNHQEAFRKKLLENAAIVSVGGGKVPGTGYDGWRFVPEGGSYEKPQLLSMAWVDDHFLETLGIRILAGQNFRPEGRYDSLWPFIINQSAALELGWADDPLYRKLEIFAPGTTEIMARGLVVGVVADYHFESLHEPVKPLVLTRSPEFGTALVRISGKDPSQALQHLQLTWKHFSDKALDYEFLDSSLEKLYTNETKLSNLILFFTAIALYLTCYGMFAMSSLLFSSRLREVAIRKVFGANHLTIIRQFYTRYALFNVVAIGLSLPVAVYIGNMWLETFPYRIDLSSAFFLKAGAFILVAGLASVTYYLLRVAYSNPVRFLRNE